MTLSNVPDDHHIVRHCKNSQYFMHEGKIRPYPNAFHLRPASKDFPEPEKTLSGVYYEWFQGNDIEKMRASCHFIPITMKGKDALLRLNAGKIRAQGIMQSVKLRVTHEPAQDCPPYSAIRGMPQKPDDKLCLLLSSLTIVDAVECASIINA